MAKDKKLNISGHFSLTFNVPLIQLLVSCGGGRRPADPAASAAWPHHPTARVGHSRGFFAI